MKKLLKLRSIFIFLSVIIGFYFLVFFYSTNSNNQTPVEVKAQTTFQPTAPYYATFYYMWYQNQTTDGAYSYWPDQGNNPPNTWFSHYLPDSNTSSFSPSTELYSSNDYNNFKWQMTQMAYAKQEVAIASWWGQPPRKEDKAFKNIITDFMARSDNPYPNLRWAMYYEKEGFADPAVSEITSDLNYILTTYKNSPYMLKIGGKLVMFVYADAGDIPGTMTQRWKDANAAVGNAFYVNLKVFPGFATDPNQPSSWHQYAPATRSGAHSPYSDYVSPGFWLDDNVSPVRLVRDLSAFQIGVTSMVATNDTWKLTETWNEWGEGTSVEPGNQVRLNTSTGKEEIDPNGTTFGSAYVDVLHNTLPALEAGTGAGGVTPPPAPPPTPPPAPPPTSPPAACKADYNLSGVVDIADFATFGQNYKKTGINCNLDLVGSDCLLNISDFAQFASVYKDSNICKTSGSTPPPTPTPTPPPAPPPAPPPTSGTTYTVATVGDIACGSATSGGACKEKANSDMVITWNPQYFIPLGDNQYESGTLSDFQTHYDPSFGRLMNITYPVVGNHEYITSKAQGYFDYFNGVGVQVGRAGDRSKGYYSFNIGSKWRVYIMNSNCSQAGGCNAGSPQETWLKNDLAANVGKCQIMAMHHPYISSDDRNFSYYAQQYALVNDFYNAGGEILLYGHSHFYERYQKFKPVLDGSGNPTPPVTDTTRGIRQFIVGTGGKNIYGYAVQQPLVLKSITTKFGSMKLSLKDTGYDWNYYAIDSTTPMDSGSDNCY